MSNPQPPPRPPLRPPDDADAGLSLSDPAWARYGLAVATVAAATLLTFVLRALIGSEGVRIVFIFFFPAILISARYGGRAPALLALALSALAGNYLFLAPFNQLKLTAEGIGQTSLFLLVAAFIVYLTELSRRAEEAQAAATNRIASTLESITDAFVAFDREWRYSYVNERAVQMLGKRPEELLGRKVWEVYPHAIETPSYGHLHRALAEGIKVEFEQEEPAVGGWIEVHAYPSTEGLAVYFHDITERKRDAEERERLAAIVDSSDDAIISKTLDGQVTSWNASAVKMYGYTEEEAVGRHISFLIPPERADELEGILEKLRRGEHIKYLETVRVRKDGGHVDVSVTISPVRDASGRVVGASTIARDITASKRAEAERRESEERFRSLADAMPQIVWTARADGYTDYYNRRWAEYTGMTLEQAEGWGWQPVIHPDDVERSLRRWATSVETGQTYSIEYRFRRASDGQYRWHLGRAMPVRDAAGRIVKWFGTSTDIHDQKIAEERLRFLAEAGELLSSSLDYETTLQRLARIAVNAMADYCIIDVIERDGQIRRAATAHADPSQEELARELHRFSPDPSRTEGVPKVLRTGKTEFVPSVTEERISGLARSPEHRDTLRRLGLKSFITVPLLTRGRIIGTLSFVLTSEGRSYTPADVTFAELIARRAALAMDNARLYGRAQEVNRAKDEFLAMLSHELRTPLTPVIGWTHMIRSGRLTGQEVEQGLRVIDKNAQSLSRLINDLLDMSSIMSGKMKIERAPVDLRAVVREAVETVRAQAAARSVAFEVTTGGLGAVNVSGDRTRLVQVFWNLLNNAVKFSREGGRVRVHVETRDGAARVEVADEGHGIEPEFLPHVFERFRQADGSTTRAHGGLGIGLALVKSFVEAHGGTVTAASDGPGAGSRFAVSLPAMRAPADGDLHRDASSADAETCADEGVCHVLVVEDARDTLELLRVVFEARGYRIDACSDAEEALRIAESSHFDIIVSDIGLPRIDGYELIKRLRRLPHLRETPAVALTGYAAPKDAEAAMAAGFDVHVPKPVDPTTLAAEIEQLLKQRARSGAES